MRLAVGVLWVCAGLLQLQPFMFTKGFAGDVLGNAAHSQPAPLNRVITFTETVFAAHPVTCNWVLAIAELLIGTAMTMGNHGRLTRIACVASIGWGLGVWCIGEGMGGLPTGHAASSTGAPGAAALYVVLTIAAFPRRTAAGGEAPLPTRFLTRMWVLIWLVGAILAALPAQWGARGLSAQAGMGWMMSPSWATGSTLAVATWLHALPAVAAALASAAMITVQLGVGLGGLRRGAVGRVAVLVGGGLSLIFWMFGQGFAGISTGTATDVGTAPLVVLLAAGVLSRRDDRRLQPAGYPTPVRT